MDSSGDIHVCYYNSVGDAGLIYGTDQSGSWVSTNIDASLARGKYCSTGLDSSDKAHISYFDDSPNELEYATNASGTWVLETVDAGDGDELGYHTSLTVDPDDTVHISYYNETDTALKLRMAERRGGGLAGNDRGPRPQRRQLFVHRRGLRRRHPYRVLRRGERRPKIRE
ncbi:MAG: hypothetical protein M5R36_15720 [Deltaproteobacteria bacterium]|nr:hypothetical protein [Deltaproteobacteria bacterium]